MYDFDGNFMILQAVKVSVIHQLTNGKELLAESDENSEALALIIDGKSLTYALEDDVKDLFLELAVGCASVICCRSSPKQKALVSFPCTLQVFLSVGIEHSIRGFTTLTHPTQPTELNPLGYSLWFPFVY